MTWKLGGVVRHNDGNKNIGDFCESSVYEGKEPTCLDMWKALPRLTGIEARNARLYLRSKCLNSSWYVLAAEWADDKASPSATLEQFIESNNIMTQDENQMLRELCDEWKKVLINQKNAKNKYSVKLI